MITTHKAEQAIAGYLRGHRDSNSDEATFTGSIDYSCSLVSDLNGVDVVEGRTTERRSDSLVIVTCETGEKPYIGLDLFECEVSLMLLTNRHLDSNNTEHAEAIHSKRSKAIIDMLMDEDAIKASLNGAETRIVEDFRIEAAWLESHNGEIYDDGMVDTYVIKVFCYPFE